MRITSLQLPVIGLVTHKGRLIALAGAVLLFTASDAHGEVCSPVASQEILFIAEPGDVHPGDGLVLVSIAENTSHLKQRLTGIDVGFGLRHRSQVATGAAQDNGATAQDTVDAALVIGLRCDDDGGPALHLNFSVGSDNREVPSRYAGLIAGGPMAFGSWRAGTIRSTASLHGYFGAAILENDISPLALEARRESEAGIWQTLFSAGLYLVDAESFELALGLAQLEGEDPRRRLMLKLTGEF